MIFYIKKNWLVIEIILQSLNRISHLKDVYKLKNTNYFKRGVLKCDPIRVSNVGNTVN